MRLLTSLRIGIYELYALALIGFTAILRIILAAFNWPMTNSDEGTMGLMARHIAYNGERPLLFYGQNYMGSLEAYIAAGLFHIFGPSLFTLRLAIILLDILFFLSIYALTSLLYSKRMALLVLALLSLGSSTVLNRQLIATGGSIESLLFGTLSLLLSAWLALTYRKKLTPERQWARFAAFSGWGVVVGLGYWSDDIVLPIFFVAGLLLLLFCWRDLFSPAPFFLMIGVAIGLIPVILHNLNAPPGQDSLSVLLGLFKGTSSQSPHALAQYIQGIKNTLLISVPIATGEPFCPVWEIPVLGVTSPHTAQCVLVRGTWTFAYVILWTISALITLRVLWKLRSRTSLDERPSEDREAIVRHVSRLFLLMGAFIATSLYAVSSAPISWPGIHARYLIILVISTPAIIWPLWAGASMIQLPSSTETPTRQPILNLRSTRLLSRAGLALIGLLLLIGTVTAFNEVPSAQAFNQEQDGLIHNLLSIGATHIYTDYWSCDRIAFISQEKIICGVLGDNLEPSHDRYYPYYTIVKADPHTAYVFPIGDSQGVMIVQKSHLLNGHYRYYVFDGYFVYQPV